MTNLEKITEELSSLTLLQAVELVKILEEKWGVTANAPVMAMAVAAPSTEEVAEKTSFTLTLVSFGEKKIDVIKVVREITNLGLTEAKAIVDAAPKAVLQDVNKTVAEEAKAKLEAAGAKVEIK